MDGDRPEDAGIAGELAELWRLNRPSALSKVAIVEDAAAALSAAELDDELREEARGAAHKLRGSLGMYGFHRAGEIAGELEDLLSAGPVGSARTPEVASLVLAMRAELESAPEAPAVASEPESDAISLLVVSDDPALGQALFDAIEERELVAALAGLDEGTVRLERGRPDVVLCDLASAGSLAEGLGFLSELSAGDSAPPVLVLAAGDGLLDRVEVVRHGARGFLNRDLEPRALIDAVERFADGLREPGATVLAVDDDESVLAALEALLGRNGFTVETADSAERFWRKLEEVVPDLAIVDLDMPQVNGIELCQALRADLRWAWLPLLILTAYRDSEVVRGAFAAGADDYLSKPIIEEELLGRVRNRLARVRAYREASERDELTGVATRRAVVAELERLAELARSAGEPFSLALLDVDRLAAINAASGLAAGDAALRRVGEWLRGELASDAVGRWDSDAFLIGFNGIAAADAARRVTAVLDRLNAREPGVTLSAGVAGASPDRIEIPALVVAAERALAEAQRAGGARLVAAGAAGEPEGERVDVAIVEDDQSVVDVLQLALENLGVTSRRFADGDEAVAALAADPPPLVARVVLLDWDLPGVDGLSVLRLMAAAGALEHTRVIMLTARASENETLKALELGATDYVAKPFSVPVLVERLRTALGR
ncbi:MAG TPA: response regulator [Solirubrobacterales bacterium]